MQLINTNISEPSNFLKAFKTNNFRILWIE